MAKYNWRQKRGPKKMNISWAENPIKWINQHNTPTITATGAGSYTIDWATMPSTTLPDQNNNVWTTVTTGPTVSVSGTSLDEDTLRSIINTHELRGISADMVVLDEVA